MQRVPQSKGEFAADHACLFQLRRYFPCRIAGMKQQIGADWGRYRGIDLPGGPANDGEYCNQEQFNERAQGSSVEAFLNCHKVARVQGPLESIGAVRRRSTASMLND